MNTACKTSWMCRRRGLALLGALSLLLGFAGCGSGANQTPVVAGVADPLPAGTSTTQILVEPMPGQDIDDIAVAADAEVIGPVPGTSWWLVAVPDDTDSGDLARRMRRDGRVQDAHEDMGMSAPEGDGSTLPAGGLLIASVIPIQPELLRIGAAVAAERATGEGVRVAVIDTGLVPHEFVDAHVVPGGWDFVDGDDDPTDVPDLRDNDADGLVDEGYGHGTFVASLIVGVAPGARILPFRVLDSDAVGTMSQVASAISMAVVQGAQVINVSIRMNDSMRMLQEAVETARLKGVCVVVSAGNTARDDVMEPFALPTALTVTAVDAFDVRAPFASFGPEVDLAAPGVELLGAWPSDTGTARWSGTSFSAALVSGACALLRELDPGAEVDSLVDRLRLTAVRLDDSNPGEAGMLGSGRVDLDAATAP